jgi:hypothetical protein
VDSIDQRDITEMKANRSPLDVIRYIMDSVVVFFGAKLIPIIIEDKVFNKKEGKVIPFLKDSWEESGKFVLGEMNFMKKLKEYEKD